MTGLVEWGVRGRITRDTNRRGDLAAALAEIAGNSGLVLVSRLDGGQWECASTPPARCPFLVGDRVQLHGYPGKLYRAFMGTVHGWLGEALLAIHCDDGIERHHTWGHLVREGEPDTGVLPCVCCHIDAVPTGQLDLFAGLGVARA